MCWNKWKSLTTKGTKYTKGEGKAYFLRDLCVWFDDERGKGFREYIKLLYDCVYFAQSGGTAFFRPAVEAPCFHKEFRYET
jgi:hypothetical protein